MLGTKVNENQMRKKVELKKNLHEELVFLDDKHRLNEPI